MVDRTGYRESHANFHEKIREKREAADIKVSDQEILFPSFTTEEFRWVEDITLNRDPTYYNYSGYNSFQPIRMELYRLADTYDFVEVEEFGKTYEGREMLALHINKKGSQNVVFLNSLIHAREWVSGCVTMNIIHRLLNYKTRDAQRLLDNFHFVIVPVVNPDGYEYSHTHNRMWRKNREPITDSDCRGVDINRNFMYGYKSYKDSDQEDVGACSEQYSGQKALEAKEASAMNMIFFKYRTRIRYYIDYHTYGNVWLHAYGANGWAAKNELQLKRYRDNALKSFQSTLGAGWRAGSVYDLLYRCHGIISDHMHYYITPIAFTVEVGNEYDEFNAVDTRISTYVISQWLAVVSQLTLLKEELESGQYMKDKITTWRRTSMQKRTVVFRSRRSGDENDMGDE